MSPEERTIAKAPRSLHGRMTQLATTSRTWSRRSFIRWAAALVGGSGAVSSLSAAVISRTEKDKETPMAKSLSEPPQGGEPLPHLEVSGTNYEIGFKIGKHLGENIRQGLRRRKTWLSNLQALANGTFAAPFKKYVAAARKHFSQYVEELQGWADGAEVPFDDLMTVNMWAELSAMKRKPEGDNCSTISLSDGQRVLLAHNEDGSAAYKGLMFWLTVRPTRGRSFQCLSYPGFLPGNTPGFNDAGIIQTTNYTPSAEWRVGIPRYFLNRY